MESWKDMQKTASGGVTPVVSVVIPVYNVAPYVREALDSVVKQTYGNLEVLIIDDGSTDGSSQICDEYSSDPRITVIHQPNQGPSNARNTALDLATGEYIAFLDPDDAYHPAFVQTLLNTLLKEKSDVVECAIMNYNLTLTSHGWTTPSLQEGTYTRSQALRGLLDVKFATGVWNKLYRAELWKGIRFPEGHFYEDTEVVYGVFARINHLYYLESPLCLRRFRPGSTTQTFNRKMAEDNMRSREQIIRFVEEHSDVFDETYINKARETRMYGVLRYYAKGTASVEELRKSAGNIDPKKCGSRGRTIYALIRRCPWMLKVLYPMYEVSRRRMWKVVWR